MNPYPQSPSNNSDPDLKKYLVLFLRNWYWFVIAMFLCLMAAWFVNKYSTRSYRVTASMLIEDDKGQTNILGGMNGQDVASGLGIIPGIKNMQNQLLIIQANSLLKRTIMELDFEVSYFSEKMIGIQEVYNEVPFVIIPGSRAQPLGILFQLTFTSDSTFIINISNKGNNIRWYSYIMQSYLPQPAPIREMISGRFGELLNGGGYAFTVLPRRGVVHGGDREDKTWFFNFNSYDRLISKWGQMLKVEPMHRDASMVSFTIETANPDKAERFLNKHLEMYLQRTLDKKNQFAQNTIEFISTQLNSISDSLVITEAALTEFRQTHKVVDLSYQAQHLFGQVSELGNRKAELQLQQDYFRYLSDYFSSTSEPADIVAPAVMGISDPLLNNLVMEINRLASEKIAMGGESTRNPYIATLNAQIRNVRNTLEENARSRINNNNQAIADIDVRLSRLTADVQRLPQTERDLFGIERVFKLNDHIYTYLLQRRYEAQIAKASNAPDNEIIDYARVSDAPIEPNTTRNYAIAFMLGLILPGLSLMLINLFNNKITSVDDMQGLTDLPIAGHIVNSNQDYRSVVLNDSQSPVAEAFRSLRARLQFFTKTTASPVVLVTSSMPAEGKSFSSLNLAAVYSLWGKKTVLVDFDLRKPGLYKEFKLKNDIGISTYLIGKDRIDDIIQESGYDNLYIITAGPTPPNPSELTASQQTAQLLKELKERYDLIVVDSAPIGMVSDTASLAALADITIMVVRRNVTIKPILVNTLAEAQQNGLTNISLLFNGISQSDGFYSDRYKYNYTYGTGKNNS